ncbi:hypothetical protein GE061_006364 [Apolygus lucorum]|uniref:Uncharacterized protein n=1 Tax=Apolygus lucorum TaxID=248454 RepID=A0A8S9WV28_APOLU|nr:hypothetical protein GE061_006364 [Apolygus lucorum]
MTGKVCVVLIRERTGGLIVGRPPKNYRSFIFDHAVTLFIVYPTTCWWKKEKDNLTNGVDNRKVIIRSPVLRIGHLIVVEKVLCPARLKSAV